MIRNWNSLPKILHKKTRAWCWCRKLELLLATCTIGNAPLPTGIGVAKAWVVPNCLPPSWQSLFWTLSHFRGPGPGVDLLKVWKGFRLFFLWENAGFSYLRALPFFRAMGLVVLIVVWNWIKRIFLFAHEIIRFYSAKLAVENFIRTCKIKELDWNPSQILFRMISNFLFVFDPLIFFVYFFPR